MVSVYDAQTQLTGFIDPNASMFTIYNTDKPNFISDGVDAASGVGTDAAMSIYTLGNITAGGFVSTASYITSASSITAAKSVTAGTYYSGGVIAPAIYYTGYTQLNYANAAGSNNADVFANPALANVANITIMSTMTNLTGSVNLYLRDPTNPSNPLSTPVLAVGEPFTVVVNNQTNGTPHIQFAGNEIRAQQPTQYYMSTLSRTVYSFVSLNNSGPSNGGGPVFLATNGGVANQNTYPA